MNTPESVARAQEVQLLRQAVQALPERCREVFILRRFQGLSHREIAVRLGISEKTVQVHHTNAMHKCVQFFQSVGAGPAAPSAPLSSSPHV